MPTPENVPADTAPLVALPGRLFFTESVACPATLDAAQAESLMRLTVESRSPFPEDKLALCRRLDRQAGKMLVFATLKERMAPFMPAAPTAHVVPDAALPLPPAEDGRLWIVTAHGLTFVKTENGAPVSIRGFTGEDEHDDAALIAARDAHAKHAGLTAGGPLWRLTGASASRKPAGVNLDWRELRNGETHTTFAATADLDVADVRPPETVAALRRRERDERRLRLAFRALGAVAALLLFAQLSAWSLHAVATHRENALDKDRPSSEAAEAKAALLDTLGKVTDRRTPQLEWLAAMNETRPDAVWLRKVAADERGLTASGQAGSVEALNGWLAALRRDKAFSEVQAPRITTGGQSVAFELRAAAATRIRKQETPR